MNREPPLRRSDWLRDTLGRSRREAVASAVMTSTCDNYLGAFAVSLRASLSQMGWLAAAPQLLGAGCQLLSVWLCPRFNRRRAIVTGVALQMLAVFGMALVAFVQPPGAVTALIVLAVVYQASGNFVQPQWRGWMGSIVPPRRRGAFFAGRTQLTMITSLAIFGVGGALLGFFDTADAALHGFGLLFVVAGLGRAMSAWQLRHMHDPDAHQEIQAVNLAATASRIREAFRHRTFRRYSFFVAGMQAAVAVSGPFFSVYMLRNLDFSYWQFSANTGTSLFTQFLTLAMWGRICDRWGNRWVMIASSVLLPLVPALWIVSPDFYYLLCVQVISGIAWGGFTLSTANYLYDLRPPRADFASYAAVQSALGALGVFLGALSGGYLATLLPELAPLLPGDLRPAHPIVLIFALSAVLRLAILTWFIPRSEELRVRHRPDVLQVIYRVSRFTPGAGIVLDWLTVARKPRDDS